jgi:hypothetical protein
MTSTASSSISSTPPNPRVRRVRSTQLTDNPDNDLFGTARAPVTYSDAATSHTTGLAVGEISAGSHKAIWLRRTMTAGSTPQVGDSAQIQFGGDTL